MKEIGIQVRNMGKNVLEAFPSHIGRKDLREVADEVY